MNIGYSAGLLGSEMVRYVRTFMWIYVSVYSLDICMRNLDIFMYISIDYVCIFTCMYICYIRINVYIAQ
jgi:hypothetical protein